MTISIPDFSTARVVVACDVMLDRYLFGSTGRISPEAPVPVVHVRDEQTMLLLHFDERFAGVFPDDSGHDRHGWPYGKPALADEKR